MICKKCLRSIPDDSNVCCYCGKVISKDSKRARTRGNGSGCVYRRGKTWTARITVDWDVDGNFKPKQVFAYKNGFKTKSDAIAYISKLKEEIGTQEDTRTCPNLQHYWVLYESGEYQNLSDSKKTAYKIAWKKLEPLWYHDINTITVSSLRNIVEDKAVTYYPARDMKMVLKHLFLLASADGFANKDTPSFIVLPKLKEKERTPFSKEEQEALWKIYDSGDKRAAIPLIMIYTGMMPGEMQMLKIEMIHLDIQQIIGVGLKTEVRKKSPVYLPDAIIPVIEDAINSSHSNLGYVFVHNEKKFYEDYYSVLEAAGCRKLEPYCCRHTTATALAITENIAPNTIKKFMRWSTTKMLDRYAHPNDEDVLIAGNTLKR